MLRSIYVITISGFLLCANGVNSDNESGCSGSLGVENRNKITDDQMSASSIKSVQFEASEGRLNNEHRGAQFGAWCPHKINDHQWLQVDFKDVRTITAVKTQGYADDLLLYVGSYALLYSYNGSKWYNYTVDTKVHIFKGQTSTIEEKKNYIPNPITARFIRINPRTWSKTADGFCLRVEFYGCTPKEDCSTAVGMEDGRIKDYQVTGSAVYQHHKASRGRLNNITKRVNGTQWGAWCSDILDQNQYLQVDLLRKRNVSAVATQGYYFDMFVRKYRLNYSIDGKTWMPCQNEDGKIEFNGNKDNETIEKNLLYSPVAARYIRFNPTKWNNGGYICMRVEIYECLPVKGSVPYVYKRLPRFTDVNNASSVNLTCIMEGQVGIIITWFKGGDAVQESETTKLKATAVGDNRMESTLSLSKVEMADNGINYACKGSYPGVTTLFTSTATVLRVGADQPALTLTSFTSTSLVLSVPYQGSNLTKGYKFQYKPKTGSSSWMEEYYNRNPDTDYYTINGLKSWTCYEVKVIPKHKDGDVGITSVLKVFCTAEGVSGPPKMIEIIEVNEYNATVEWRPPKEGDIHGKIKGYIIKYNSSNNDKPLEVTVSKVTKYTLVSLLPNIRYELQICVVNGAGRGEFSTIYSFTTHKEFIPTPTPTLRNQDLNLEKLNEINITKKNVKGVALDVKNLTSKTYELQPKDVALTADILKKIVTTNVKDAQVGDNILGTINHVLDVKNDVLKESNARHNTSSRFVKILEEYVENGGQFSKNTSNILIRIDRIGRGYTEGVNRKFDGNASITIPKEVLEDSENKTIYFIYYKNGKLFDPKRFIKEICQENGFTENVYEISTPVLSGSIAGKSVKNLSERVIIKFTVPDPKAVKDSSSCVYWDFNEAGGTGGWSSKGCKRQKVYNNTIECACDHMTNFAALLDVYAATSKACGAHADALTMISYVGCLLSITGLSLTIFTYLFFRRLRKELAAKILIQLCIALLCVLVVFLAGIERSRVGPIGCYVVAVLLHYFVLAAFLWMLIEAHFMYLAFVKVWTQHGDHDLLKCSLIAWGLPAIVVGVTMAVNLDNYGGNHYCRIERIPFYAAFFAPILCIIFINLIVFGVILYKLNTRPDSSIVRERNAKARRMKQAVGIMILVGITWSFGALAVSRARLIFHYLFAIFNSIQGFSIFLFYCLSQKNVRDCWMALLTCQLNKLQKNKSFYTDTYDRRRCSTGSTTHNTTLSLARKKTSTSSGNTMYPTHSMDTLTRDFTSYNCSSGTLRRPESNKQNNLNNAVSKNCNVKDDNHGSNPDVWKRMSNVRNDDEAVTNCLLTDIPFVISSSRETISSEDGTEKCDSYDLVASSNCNSQQSLSSSDFTSSQTSDKRGFYSFINSKDSFESNSQEPRDDSRYFEGDDKSPPGTPIRTKRPLRRKQKITLSPSTERPNSEQLKRPNTSDPFGVRDDFGKLIVNPNRGSVRGVIGVVETSVDTYDEDFPNVVTPQGVRLTKDFNGEHGEYDPNECIASPAYFAENRRASRGSKERNLSISDNPIGDVFL